MPFCVTLNLVHLKIHIFLAQWLHNKKEWIGCGLALLKIHFRFCHLLRKTHNQHIWLLIKNNVIKSPGFLSCLFPSSQKHVCAVIHDVVFGGGQIQTNAFVMTRLSGSQRQTLLLCVVISICVCRGMCHNHIGFKRVCGVDVWHSLPQHQISLSSVEACCLGVGEIVGHQNILSASRMNGATVIFFYFIFLPLLPPSKKVTI